MKSRFRVTRASDPVNGDHFGEWFDGLRSFEMAARHARWLDDENNFEYVVWDLKRNQIVYRSTDSIAEAYERWQSAGATNA